MPQPYPTMNVNTTEGLLAYAGTVTNGYVFPMILLAALIIIFSITKSKGYRTSDSIMVASFLTLIIGSFFWAIDLMAFKWIAMLLAMVALSALASVIND